MATTMVKDTNFNMRINKQKKTSLEDLYANLGMTLPEAVNVFFEKSLMVGGIPFDVRMPHYNKETEAFGFYVTSYPSADGYLLVKVLLFVSKQFLNVCKIHDKILFPYYSETESAV